MIFPDLFSTSNFTMTISYGRCCWCLYFFFCFQLNRPTSFTTSSASELNGFVDNQLPNVYSASFAHPDSEKDPTLSTSNKSPRKDTLQTISFKPKENQIGPSTTPSISQPKTASETKSHDQTSATSSKIVSAADLVSNKNDSVSRNFSFDNKEIELLKNRRVSLCVPGSEHDPHPPETRRASSPFTNGGTELLIGPHEENRLKTTAIIEDSRRSSG